MTDEELIEKFNIPDNWARTALIFATRNSILTGRGASGICPFDNTTRAEMATILVRLLNTTGKADLSGYSDVVPNAWYYNYMAIAVKNGLITERAPGVMAPNANITREEVCVALAKLYGTPVSSRQPVYGFSDWRDISSDQATLYLAGLISNKYLAGNNGMIHPQDPITRQELAQFLNCLFHRLGDRISNKYYYGKYCLLADQVEPGTVVTGNLYVSNEAKEMTLENVKVTKQLIIQGDGLLKLKLVNCEIGELVICRSTVVTVEGGGVKKLFCMAGTKLIGEVPSIHVSASFVLESGSKATYLYVWKDDVKMTIAGEAENVRIDGKNVYMNGVGSIENLTVNGAGLINRVQTANVTEQLDPLLSQIKATRTDSGKATTQAPQLTLGYQLTNMPAGKRDCTVTWTVDGTQVKQERVLLSEGSTVTCDVDFTSYVTREGKQVPFTVVITSLGETFRANGTVNAVDAVWQEAQSIRTQAVQARINTTTNLYSSFNSSSGSFTGLLQSNVPAGTQVTILKTTNSRGARVRLPSGKEGWIAYSAMSVISGTYYTTKDYSTAAKELYVNQIKKCSSNTRYLIWVSLYTQRVNIFEGSKGNWKLIRTGPCASGRNACPTPVENVTIQYKTAQWTYAHYYCHHVSVFDESRGFHSRPTRYEGGIYDYAIGYPASAGCVRLLDEDCIWIYQNVPTGTAVHIY